MEPTLDPKSLSPRTSMQFLRLPTRIRVPVPLSFFNSFCCLPFFFPPSVSFCFLPFSPPFVSFFAFFALCFSFRVPSLLGGGFCYSVFCRGATPPSPHCLRAWSTRSPLACCLLFCVLAVYLFNSSLPSLFVSSGQRLCVSSSIFLWVLCCLLSVGFCCNSFSI